ncbi:DUF1648 domain-containing protein [Lysinibacillus fusiformis]|uniref:DUF1648 domain-containing protein n=1 Tax=Lysinibacillus fusiformis TaxID=28031 RepID=UPI00215B759B|nr:DUF1648 domain-containing protein [Lysinibacillus fusiformis]MCR8852360.1 DUF1648 domain-containing protein [Lysinibacillus fusiformis]WKT78845.1 DUF1648 domain-containing protein [Lysinibacillus fusiformis]
MQTQQKTPTPRFCHQLTVIVATIFLAGFTATLIQYRKLPATIPVLQSFTSDHAQFGPKIAIFYLPFIALMLFLLLHYLEMKAAYPVMKRNKPPLSHSQRQNGIMTFCLIKNSILLYFTYSLFNDLSTALGRDRILQQWHAYLFLFLLCGIFSMGIVRGILLNKKR